LVCGFARKKIDKLNNINGVQVNMTLCDDAKAGDEFRHRGRPPDLILEVGDQKSGVGAQRSTQ
jgi:hypothetical protein